MGQIGRKIIRGLSLLLIVGFVVWTIAPLIVMAYTSLSSSGITPGAQSISLNLDNYRQVISDSDNSFGRTFLFSVFLATAVALVSLIIGFPAAYSLARHHTLTTNMVGGWIFSSRFLPPVVAAIPLFILFRQFDLVGNPAALVFLDLLVGLPVSVWALRSYIEDLPGNLEALASTDEVGPITRILFVIAPAVQRPLLTVGALIWLFVWNEYFLGLMFSRSLRPVTVLIASWNTYEGVQWGPACAAGTMAAAPAVLILLLSLRLLAQSFGFGWKLGR